MKLPITKEQLYDAYKKHLDQLLEDCDWISVINGNQVAYLVHKALKDFYVDIDPDRISEVYSNKVQSLNLTSEEWREQYGSDVPKIIGLIHESIEEQIKTF